MSSGREPVLIVDDHPVVLYGLRFLLRDSERFTVCGEALDVATARAAARAMQPRYVILDLVLGGRDGLDLLADLCDAAPEARILVYSSQNEWRFARRCLAAGARGYVSKSEGLSVVGGALDVLAAGDTYLGAGVRRKMIEAFEVDASLDASPTIDQLSDRELQVLRMLGDGHTSREIADGLELSVKTVGTYLERLKLKLQRTSLRDLEAFARDHALRPDALCPSK